MAPVTIVLILASMVALAVLELWLFWTLGERDDRRHHHKHQPPVRPTSIRSRVGGAAGSTADRRPLVHAVDPDSGNRPSGESCR